MGDERAGGEAEGDIHADGPALGNIDVECVDNIVNVL